MSDHEDDFKDVEQGLPSTDTAQKSSIKILAMFLAGGVIIALIVFQLGDSIAEFMEDSFGSSFIPAQVLMTGLASLFLGSLQAWIFRSKIKARLPAFIGFSLLGGVAGGLVGGTLMNAGFTDSATFGAIIGAVNGLLAGGISSSIQNRLMGTKKYGWRWFLYNTISWALIFAVAWYVAWVPNPVTTAVAGGLLVVASGVSLTVFLRKTPQIEFS